MAESVRDESSSAVVVANRGAIVRAGGSPSDVIDAFGEYQQIQSALDRALPDCIMEIQGRKFRKKNYWRAIGTAFNLDVTCEREERTTVPDDWGYVVTYRATAPNGRSTTGDGACFASEKAVYAKDWSGGKGRVRLDADGQPVLDTVRTRENQTTHNVRGHAHTRAFNRAVSNLVGFGEVSAEEMQRERHEDEPRDVSPKRTSVARSTVAEVFNAPAAKAAPATPSGDWMDEPLGFGKHANRSWRYMATTHPDYLTWMIDKAKAENRSGPNTEKAAAALEWIIGINEPKPKADAAFDGDVPADPELF